MRFIAFATHNARYYDNFILSASKAGLSLDIVGQGMKWKGFGFKLKAIYNHILKEFKAAKLKLDDIVCVCDAFDSVYSGYSDVEALYRKLSHTHEFLMGLEAQSTHLFPFEKITFGDGDQGKMINGGCWISTVRGVFKVLCNICIQSDYMDDQVYFSKLHKLGIIGDDQRLIFYNMKHPSDDFGMCPIVSYPFTGDMTLVHKKLNLPYIRVTGRLSYLSKVIPYHYYLFACGLFRYLCFFVRWIIFNIGYYMVPPIMGIIVIIGFMFSKQSIYIKHKGKNNAVSIQTSIGYGHLTQLRNAINYNIIPKPKCIIIESDITSYITDMFPDIPIESIYTKIPSYILSDGTANYVSVIPKLIWFFIIHVSKDIHNLMCIINKYDIGHIYNFFSLVPSMARAYGAIFDHTMISTNYEKIVNSKILSLCLQFDPISTGIGLGVINAENIPVDNKISIRFGCIQNHHVKSIGPLIRNIIFSPVKNGKILVYLRDGFLLDKILLLLLKANKEIIVFSSMTPNYIHDRITYKNPDYEQFGYELCSCSGLITTGGVETLCEANICNIPVLSIPVNGDREQDINAYYASTIFKSIFFGGYDVNINYGCDIVTFIELLL